MTAQHDVDSLAETGIASRPRSRPKGRHTVVMPDEDRAAVGTLPAPRSLDRGQRLRVRHEAGWHLKTLDT